MPVSATLCLAAYLLVGPTTVAAVGAGVVFGRARMGRLARSRATLPPDPPRVTVLIPARNEAAGIGECLRGVLGQDYPAFDVLAIDDRSTDGTGAALDALAAADRRLRVVHVPPGDLPPGWLGKNHALHAGTAALDGGDAQTGGLISPRSPPEWLLFVDSDVTLQPHALTSAVALAVERGYDAVSILTRVDARTALERLVIPPAAATWAAAFVVSLTNDDDRRGVAAANGQFLLVRRSAYDDAGGHAAVRDRIVEDVELMRRLKSRGRRVRLFSGGHLAATRMHATWPEMTHGWARIYAGTARRRPGPIVAALAFWLVAVGSSLPALAWGVSAATSAGGTAWLVASAAHVAFVVALLGAVYRWAGQSPALAFAYPIAGGAVASLLSIALRRCRGGSVAWRGSAVEMAGSS